MRAIWKGYLKCSPVTVPIKRVTVTPEGPRQFRLSHKASGSRIHPVNVCSVCGQSPLRCGVTFQEETHREVFRAPVFKRLST